MNVEKRVQDFIRKQQLFADDAEVLVALSGGADSVALLRILVRLGYRCRAVHCNFHLRDKESDRDEQFVTDLCRTLNVECEVVHFDTSAYAAEHKQSIEMAARELRYREFERLRREHNLDVIAVAHHQDDAVETLLLNLIRGAGINGLTGMRVKNGHVVRPLLCLTREDITGYLDQKGQPYVTDSTNLTDMYARNKVRLNLLPLMEQINPTAKSNIMQAALHLGEAATIYNKVMTETNAHIVIPRAEGCDISIPALLDTDVPKAHLFELLYPYGFNSAQVRDILRSLSSEAGRVFQAANYTLLRDRTHLLLRPITQDTAVDTIYTLPEEGTMQLPDGTRLNIYTIKPDATWQVPRRSDMVCLDASRIAQPLTLRHPRQGDRFSPFGMRGSKLLSDFYTDIKLPHTEKSHQWLLCHGEEIVWAVGLRGSERYRLDKNTKKVICIERLTTND
ncbi:MAG: tRNA lysidine(34) synthetase TilS [Bacteroidaceae bacterium]|nr:tRNA lysidine(34) synthetase TilS [Bacteroidaceae bacterium]